MEKDILIGCDVGTSGAKAVAMTAQGEPLASAHRGYGLITPRAQWAEQWPSVWVQAAVETIGEVVSRIDPNRVACVSISALYGGTGILLDSAMKPLRPAIIWMDRRATEETQWVLDHIGQDRVFALSGNGVDSYFGYVKLLWVQKHEPEVWKRVCCILPVHSYLVYEMTGEITADHCSAGNIGGIYDMAGRCWSQEMCRALEIDPALLPRRLLDPTDIAGGLNSAYARALGLPEGTPLVAGTVDCIVSMLSAAMAAEGDNAAVLGTSLNWGFLHTQPLTDPGLISMPYCVRPKEMLYTYGGASTAGALPRWFVSNLAGGESGTVYDELQDEVARQRVPAGSHGLVALPYFMGERTPIWDENATGAILGLSLSHTRADIYRCLLESAAYSLRHIMESTASGSVPASIVLVGGGSKSTLWKQIFADVTGASVLSPIQPLEAPLGDAFLAAMAMGLQEDFAQVRQWVPFQEPVLPQAADHEAYQAFFQVYRGLYATLRKDMHALKRLASQS